MTEERKATIAERLAALYQKHGHLTPALVVKDAASPKSPLHDEFEWDDGKAAAAYREEQARTLIRSVSYIVRTDTTVIKTVAYVRDPNAASDEQGYVSVESLQNDAPAARAALQYEVGRAQSLLERSRHLALALGLVGEVDALIHDLTELRERAAA